MPDFNLGCKRLIVGADYYETYNRSNVSLVNIKDSPIEKITTSGIVVSGVEYEVDTIVQDNYRGFSISKAESLAAM